MALAIRDGNYIVTPAQRKRLYLVAIMFVFAAPLLIAFGLHLLDWQPSRTSNVGTLVMPPQDVSETPVTLVDGSPFDWKDPHWYFTLVVLPGDDCVEVCLARLDELLRMRVTLTQKAERLRIVYLGPPLSEESQATLRPILFGRDDAARFSAYVPAAGEVADVIVDPNGQIILSHAPGTETMGVRKDLSRLIR